MKRVFDFLLNTVPGFVLVLFIFFAIGYFVLVKWYGLHNSVAPIPMFLVLIIRSAFWREIKL